MTYHWTHSTSRSNVGLADETEHFDRARVSESSTNAKTLAPAFVRMNDARGNAAGLHEMFVRAVRSVSFGRLFDKLRMLSELDDDESLFIERNAYVSACSVLSLLAYDEEIPPPKVFAHGGDAVVFSWSRDDATLQLTICNGFVTLGLRPIGMGVLEVGHSDLSQGGARKLVEFIRGFSGRAGAVYSL